MVKILPQILGYTVDERLKEFRKVKFIKGEPTLEFVPFDSEKGRKLLEIWNKVKELGLENEAKRLKEVV